MINFGKFNRHWAEGFYYGYERKRELFDEMARLLEKRQIVAITGLRRTGKTVLMKQAINHLIAAGVQRRNILYFSFDEQKPALDELMSEYVAATAADIENGKIFVFLDEVQKLHGWQEQVKTYYDNYENIKFFVSGSASLFIEKKATESLAGRIYTLELPVLSFREFLAFRGKERISENPTMFAEEARQEFLAYARRNFIETINETEENTRLYLESIINKIVYEDIPSLFPVENPEKLKSMVQAIYSSPGMLINYESFGNDLGLNPRTTEKYLGYLVKSRLVKKLYNYSANFLTSEKKSKKVYMTAPAFCFLAENHRFPKIAENLVALDRDTGFFWRTPQKDEIDFIARRNGKILPIESKYSEKVSSKDLRALKKFMGKNSLGEALIIVKEAAEAGKTFSAGNAAIRQVPLWQYALSQKI